MSMAASLAPPARVLIVGDSTALGVGAQRPEETLAARIALDFAHVNIENRAANGARTRDVLVQLEPGNTVFDAILIIVGGNDVIRFTPRSALAAALRRVLRAAQHKARWIVIANSGNVGSAPRVPWPLRYILSRRSLSVARVFREACQGARVRFVNFTFPTRHDPFARDVKRYFASDGIHPSGAAYGYCYARLCVESGLARALRSQPART